MSAEYRIEGLARASGATVRTIRGYLDRGLLPRPERRGRANVYGETHLARLRQIADLLDRGYSLAAIKELREAWDTGRGLGGVLGLVAEVDGPWKDEEAARISRAELAERFGGEPDDRAVAEALELGVLERIPGCDDLFLVPSPQELSVAAKLYASGVPLPAMSGPLRELRGRVEQIADRHHLRRRLAGEETSPEPVETGEVALPVTTIQAVEALVGVANVAAFVTAATERELQTRTLDALAPTARQSSDIPQIG
ncbi:MerR family transcriptional regulator [Streptomyces sp. SID1121]|uniref:MerR family transcriptional regulator n=1 Tax=Streptomyces sp. SID1121 TaxID=3425888 RepID=UPI0040573CB6